MRSTGSPYPNPHRSRPYALKASLEAVYMGGAHDRAPTAGCTDCTRRAVAETRVQRTSTCDVTRVWAVHTVTSVDCPVPKRGPQEARRSLCEYTKRPFTGHV